MKGNLEPSREFRNKAEFGRSENFSTATVCRLTRRQRRICDCQAPRFQGTAKAELHEPCTAHSEVPKETYGMRIVRRAAGTTGRSPPATRSRTTVSRCLRRSVQQRPQAHSSRSPSMRIHCAWLHRPWHRPKIEHLGAYRSDPSQAGVFQAWDIQSE